MIAGTFIQVFSSLSISDPTWSETLFSPLLNTKPSLRPDKINNYEPIRKRFRSPSDAAKIWQGSIYWTKKRPKSSGSIDIVKPGLPLPRHDTLDINIIEDELFSEEQFISVFEQWSESCKADIGYLHTLTEPDLEQGWAYREVSVEDQRIPSYGMYWTTHELRRYIPNIHWMMVFGPPYIELFGESRLLSAPAYRTWKSSDARIHIQLTKSLHDLKENYAHVSSIREQVKSHLGHEAFYKPWRATFHAPTFHFPERDITIKPRTDPIILLSVLKDKLCRDAREAITSGGFRHPLVSIMDIQERYRTCMSPYISLENDTDEEIFLTMERLLITSALTQLAGGIARPCHHQTPHGDQPAVELHLEHETGYCEHLLLPYDEPFTGFDQPVQLPPKPYVYQVRVPPFPITDST
ncbi:hypothetical protein G6O69_33585 [Pseudenhygromyxa sp. WMMC2535]|uniref:hypothetical protein n=1 Tax=Pseudenhygromyxa sp. WMMC2535 TaxID=2712867 RepID=UPI0015577CD8|nr:hypothetical protein [Pseudenhygromyxa sp. WMMC2535]NVB42803.1 hypothetical protein [Pseudenhygromyxa sp. WMMC2535]